MKFNLIKSTVFANGWRCGAVLLASVCIVWVAFISSSAQLKTQKHVTSLEIGQASEGARVTVISDLALNDYEAFRRGDRFYVKIPLAEFAFSQPRFHGDGFDDVQVQKVGDSVVVSFKLQPGASAHVDQRSNRLDVIFTAPNRSHRGNSPNVATNRATAAGVNNSTTSNQERQRDAAGPMPSIAPQTSRERFVNAPRSEVDETRNQPARNSRATTKLGRTSKSQSAPVASSAPVKVASATPPQIKVASATPPQNYPAVSSYTPAPAPSTPVSSTVSKPGGVSAGSPNWNNVREWFFSNRNASLLGALLLAGLLVLLAAFLYRRRTTKAGATRVKHPLAQPKYASSVALDELSTPRSAGAEVLPKPQASGVPAQQPSEVAAPYRRGVAANGLRFTEGPEKSDWNRAATQPAFASAGEVAGAQASVRSKPSIGSAVATDSESINEEREVFEL
jgi:hypothetical protein